MTGIGFKAGVHGDDFATTGRLEDTIWLEKELQDRFDIKTHMIGKGQDLSQEGKVFNRVIRRTEEGWEYEADPRHAELIVRTLNLNESKAVTTAGEDDKEWKLEEDSEPLEGLQAREYRGIAARANYLAADRADIQYAVKEICRGMATPTRGG